MDRAKFFARLKGAAPFSGKLSAPQVQGIEAILDSAERNRVTDPRQVAHVLGEVFHETGGHMLPIKETVFPSHKDKNPSDKMVISRLDRAWKAGKLGTVKTPYWRDGWFGRGPIQITHKTNYEKLGKVLGVDLVGKPELALDPKIGADIAVVGCRDGLFRKGHKLSTYFSASKNDPRGARNIVNGDVKKNGGVVADHHAAFLAAINAAGSAAPVKPTRPPKPAPVEDVYASKTMIQLVQARLTDLGYPLGSRDRKTGQFDGIIGTLTKSSIRDFRADNDLPEGEHIDAALVAALETAKPRKLAAARQDAEVEKVAESAPETAANWRTEVVAKYGAAGAFVLAAIDWVAKQFAAGQEALQPVLSFAASISLWVWLLAAVVILGALWWNSRKGREAGVEAFRTGARL